MELLRLRVHITEETQKSVTTLSRKKIKCANQIPVHVSDIELMNFVNSSQVGSWDGAAFIAQQQFCIKFYSVINMFNSPLIYPRIVPKTVSLTVTNVSVTQVSRVL